jgi:hypothetical protein
MSTFDIDSNIRIVIPVGEITAHLRERLIESSAFPSKDQGTWTIDTPSEKGSSGLQNTLEGCLKLVDNLMLNSWWSGSWSVSIWMTISSNSEFVGLVVPEGIAKQAGATGVDLVFSVYCFQETT